MKGKSLIYRWRLTVLGAALCLLAMAFSFEAKIAWYSPAGTLTHISAAKLQPTDAPRHVAQALIDQAFVSPPHHMRPASELAWFAMFVLLAAAVAPLRRNDSELAPVCAFPGFFPSCSSRPPPSR
jgi:hypothetical protein